MKKEKKNNFMLILGVILIVAIVTIGYASLQANLEINGTANLGGAQWNVHLDNVVISNSNTGTASILPEVSDDGLSIDYTVTLSTPGDFYEFTVDVVNEGSIDAVLASHTMTDPQMDTVGYEVKIYDEDEHDYFDVDWNDFELDAGDIRTLKVRVEFLKDADGDDLLAVIENGPTLNLSLTLGFVQN